jgi:hypothetical protein
MRCTHAAHARTSNPSAESCWMRPITTRFVSPSAQMTTPKAMSSMLRVTGIENFSVASMMPLMYTRPGMSDLVI